MELLPAVVLTLSRSVEIVEIVEDTIGEPLVAAHVYFAIKDANDANQKRDLAFGFMLKQARRR